jgi:dihydrofolate reductase
MTSIALVVARAANGVIGKDGALPWHLPEDLKRFKALTMGKPIIMGRKTWDSLPRKPLPGRTNIVITNNADFKAEGAVVVTSLDAAIARAKDENPPEIMIIGGSTIYKQAMAFADTIHLTQIHKAFDGDKRFLPMDHTWSQADREDHETADGLKYSYITWRRNRA